MDPDFYNHLFNKLMSHFKRICVKSATFVQHRRLDLEFFLAFNGFTTFYLNRINKEGALWNPSIHEELTAIWGTILANQTPEETMRSLEMDDPVINIDKFINFLDWSYLIHARGIPSSEYSCRKTHQRRGLDNLKIVDLDYTTDF
jgi:hypothetical protein